MFRNLDGNSGCKVLLFEKEEKSYVRKISRDLDYNLRLQKQCSKQENYSNSSIKTPEILKKGYTSDGLFFFDMAYIHGISLSRYIQTIDICKIEGLVDIIIKNIIDTSSISNKRDCNEIFYKKIEDLEKKITEFQKEENMMSVLKLLKQHNWNSFSKSNCHGDLTLENIIVKGDELYLIDFLDSFYDSWILDLGKLMQDVECMWSYRYNSSNANTIIRLRVFRDLLIKKISRRDPDLLIEIYYALLLHLIRIYPYIKDEITLHFLTVQIRNIKNTILELGRNYKNENAYHSRLRNK